MDDPKLSRRDFLRWFSDESAVTVSRVLMATVPLLGSVLANQKRPRVVSDEEIQANARCTRCYAPFNAERDESLCPDCRAAEAKNRSLLQSLYKSP